MRARVGALSALVGTHRLFLVDGEGIEVSGDLLDEYSDEHGSDPMRVKEILKAIFLCQAICVIWDIQAMKNHALPPEKFGVWLVPESALLPGTWFALEITQQAGRSPAA
ncbi:hypothetical protein NLJ89_g969 [Agrocybe chaxingu]|uniref:Uncharacterized protein n=1 Tax=Agrocybe chaxingu TaxID=84603 RepID=A0A9W8N121_9AGAR|nr:hypothetical protein NLJ89_g969 [Agrocybe chaxingu]